MSLLPKSPKYFRVSFNNHGGWCGNGYIECDCGMEFKAEKLRDHHKKYHGLLLSQTTQLSN